MSLQRKPSEPGEPAQITEERSYLSAMAFELLLSTRSDDQISHLGRQKPPEPAHAFDFAYLVGDAPFELLVEFHQLLGLRFYLLSSPAQFLKQSRVLNGNDRLGREVLDYVDLLFRKGICLLAKQKNTTD